MLTKQATKESKLIAFQYKVIHNYVATITNLKIWGLIDNDKCSHCKEIETLMHMIATCTKTKKKLCPVFWTS